MFGNSLYDSMWMQSGCPENIQICDQKLDCRGPLREKRFGNPAYLGHDGKRWDGIHMRGHLAVRHYTNSMVNILSDVNPLGPDNYHQSCPQTNYQRRHNFVSSQQNNMADNYQYQNSRHRGNNRHFRDSQSHQQTAPYGDQGQRYEQQYVRVSNRYDVLGN